MSDFYQGPHFPEVLISPGNAAFYNGDTNPFIVKGNQADQIKNPIGAYVTATAVADPPSATQTVFSMAPFLSVAETQPVFSLLDIYWETSLSGKISVVNGLLFVFG